MPQTGNALIDACAGELNRDDLKTTGSSYSESKGLLNDTLRDLFNRYTFSWRVLDPPLSVPAVVSQKLYNISTVESSGVQDIYAVVLDTGGADSRPLIGLLLKTFLNKWANVDYLGNSRPVHFAKIDKHKFYVAPLPDATYTFKVFYTRMFVDITNFALDIEASDRAMEVIKIGLLARMYRWTHEFQTSSGFFTLFEKKIAELIEQDKLDPSREFEMQPANFGSGPISTDYWKSPFIRSV